MAHGPSPSTSLTVSRRTGTAIGRKIYTNLKGPIYDDRTTTMELVCFAPLAPCSMAEGYASSARYHRLKQNSANIQLIMTSDPYSCFSFFFRDSKLKMYSIFLFFCVFVSPIIFFSNFFINFFFLILILLFYYLFSLSLLFILKLINNQMFCDIDICSFCR